MVQTIQDPRRRQGQAQPAPPTRPQGGRVPPHNLEAEQSLLGAMLLSRDAIAAAVETCGADDFYKPAHAHVFDAITSLYSQGEPADPVTVADELNRAGLLEASGGLTALISLQADTPATANAGRYAKIVEEHALLRRLIGVAGEIAELGYSTPEDVDAVVDEAETLVFEVAERRTTDTLKPLNKLLGDSLDRLEALYERGESVTGIPTGFTDIDERLSGLQKSALIIVGARPAMGKCVAWDTRVLDPATGALATVEDLFRRHGTEGKGSPVVLSLGEDRKLRWATVGAFVDDGVKEVHVVRTRSGRRIRTTASHPFLTPEGWRPLADLAVGARVAVPGVLRTDADDTMDRRELLLLAHLLAQGSGLGPAPTITATDPELLAEVAGLVGPLGARLVRAVGPAGVVHRVATPAGRPDLVSALLARHGLLGVRPPGLRVPDAVFGLAPAEVEVFVGRLVGEGLTTPSERLARDVAHLLLRLGVAADLRPTARARRRAWVVERSAVAARRTPVGAMAAASDPAPGPDVWFDEVVAITADGEDRVYDLTVPGTHNFVADDVVVHNTAFALGIAAHAAVEAQQPVLVFSLEMSHSEITQRLLVSESRVDANRMRTGKLLPSDWPKVSNAIGRLGEAPLFIDDNPRLTVMELRAKARRLKAKQGALGLIVVDYLQLMSGRHNAENRQVEISEISRGLKVLARELEVPVVALSQLSRNLEVRADKRPILADLRESGSLEQDADVVMFLYRDEIYNSDSLDRGTAEVIVSKHRNGPTGKAMLAFVDNYTLFANMARDPAA